MRAAALGAIIAVAALVGLSSRLPYTLRNDDESVLRLSWRIRMEPARDCRSLSEEEQADIPIHMRQAEECEVRAVPYLLQVAIDDEVALREPMTSAASRGDRPLFVHRDLPIASGQHSLRVSLEPARSSDDQGQEVVLERGFTVEPGEVVLVTYDETQRALRLAP